MARIIEAPKSYYLSQALPGEVRVFLAGGIMNVPNWQKQVCDVLMDKFADKPLVIFNPRRENYPMNDPAEALTQIKWEFDMLDKSQIFSMFFSAGFSDQPICMFEYGKFLERATENGWDYNKRFVVTAEKDYRRYQDVVIQTCLADRDIKVNTTLQEHIDDIIFKVENNFTFMECRI